MVNPVATYALNEALYRSLSDQIHFFCIISFVVNGFALFKLSWQEPESHVVHEPSPIASSGAKEGSEVVNEL